MSLVSILMPSFNQARFIESAVRSVLSQDYQPLELVVVDGGSTDGTLQRLETLLIEYGSRLRWVSEKDSGPANAINKALRLARGGIIGWLNSDDLFTPGALFRAVRHLEMNPSIAMVYGEGEHIDDCGNSLGRYPTRPPSGSIQDFHDGCFICQPTVFLRRKVFEQVGYFDESLATAFDFDMWLRIFLRFPGQIAYIDAVQAFSRLHGDCITQRMRRMVALEGIRVLARHVGKPSPNWLLTYVDELCAIYPFGGDIADIRTEVRELVDQVKDCLDADGSSRLMGLLSADKRIGLSLPGVFAGIHPDGWAPQVLRLRIRKPAVHSSSIRLQCQYHPPVFRPLSLRVKTSWGVENRARVEEPGGFELVVDFSSPAIGDNLVVMIESEPAFVPKLVDPESSDGRRLSFIVEGIHLDL